MNKVLKYGLITVAVLVVAYFGLNTWTKSHSPVSTVSTEKGDLKVKVVYCQPSKKGRKIFGDVVPFGEVWRTGANEATLISFSKDVMFGDKAIKAGEYTLWSLPTENSFAFIINSEVGQWGTQYDAKTDVAKAEAALTTTKETTELLNISMAERDSSNNIVMNLKWDQTQAKVTIK